MVAVVSGSGLGLFGSSASVLGGVHGNAGLGRGTDRLYINSATGNLVVQSVDESLAALGLDVSLVRTYNSQGLLDDDNGDNWRLGVHQRLYNWTGTINTAGSTVTKVFGDGSEVVYRYSDEIDAYVSTEGDGAHDTIEQDGTDWVWTDGSSRNTETYNANGRLQATTDADGNDVDYIYDNNGLLTEIHDASGQQTFLDYVGNDLAAIRVVSNGQTQTLTRYYYDNLHRLRQVVVDLTPGDNAAALVDSNSDGIFETVDDQSYVTTYTYDGTSKRIASITQGDGTYVAFTYEEVEGTYRVKTYKTSAAGASGVGTSDERVTTLSYSGAGMTAEESALSTTDSVTTTTHYALDQTLFPPSWSTPALLENGGLHAVNPQITFDALGNGLAVWAQGSDVFARRYTAATNTWGSVVTLDSSSDSTTAPTLAIDRDTGDAIVAWGEADATSGRVAMSRFTASSGTWSTASELGEWEGTGLYPSQLSVSLSGHYAAVAWAQGTESNRELLQVIIKHGVPSEPALIENLGEPADQVQVQIDSNGNALTVWRQSDLTAHRIFFNRWRDATQAYSGPTLLDTLGDGGSWPLLKFDEQGNAFAVWGQWNGLQVRRFDAVTNSWGPAVAVQTTPDDFWNWQLAVDEQGNALVAWMAGPWNSATVHARRFDAATGEWGTTATLNSGNTSRDDAFSVSISGSNAVVAWVQTNGSSVGDVYAARLGNGTWSAAQLLDTRTEGAGQVNAAVDDEGRVSVLWQQADGVARSVYEQRFDNSGHSYTVPSGATWQSIANTLYGVNSAAAGDALRIALGNPTLTTGAQLNNLPATLDVSVTQTTTVPAYYVVQPTDTWTSITEAIYGTSDPFVVAELQELLDNPPLVPGMHLTVPLVLNSTRTHVVDPLGNVTTYIKNSEGRLFAVLAPEVDGRRQQTYYDYDYDGNVTVITEDPTNLNRTTTFEYDERGNVIKTRDASGTTVTRTYNANNQVLSETRYRDVDTDGFGPSNPEDALTTRYVYDSESHLRFTVSAAGHVTENRYNAAGQRISTLSYTSEGYFEATISESELESFIAGQPGRERTDYAYDFRGNLQTVSVWPETDELGAGVGTPSVTRFVYDQRGRLLQTIQPRGELTPETGDYSTTFTYDGLGRLLTTTQFVWNGESRTSLNDYDDADNRIVTTIENGDNTLVTTSLYNGVGELIDVTARTGQDDLLGTTTFIYDDAGRLCITTDPVGVRTYRFYDSAGRQVATVDGDGTFTQFFYSSLGQLVKTAVYGDRIGADVLAPMTDNQGQPNPDEYHIYALSVGLDNVPGRDPSKDRITRQVFDAAGKLTFTIDDVGAVVGYKYDGAGQVIEQVQYANVVDIPSGWEVLQPRDVEVQVDPEHDRRTRNFYDNDDRVLGTLDAAGYLIEYKYNAGGQLIEKIAYATETNEALRDSGSLEDLRPARDDSRDSWSPTYDIRTRYFYDGRGRLVGELDGEGYLTEKIYGEGEGNRDLLSSVTRYDKKLTYQDGDTFSDLKHQIVWYADIGRTTLYRYNGVGEVVKETVQVGNELAYSSTSTEFQYDLAGRVVRTVRGYDSVDARIIRVRYDALGRVTRELTAEGNAEIEEGMDPETAWQLYGVTHTYDNAGRRTSTTNQYGDRTVFYYDDDGRLAYTVNALGEVQHSKYDAFGRVIETITYDRRIDNEDLAELEGGCVTAQITSAIYSNPTLDSRTTVNYEYVEGGERITTSTAEGTSTTQTTDAFGALKLLATVRAGEGVLEKYFYDRRGLLTETHWDAATSEHPYQGLKYDAFGRVVAVLDVYNNVTRTEYDALGRVLATVDPMNARRCFTYDAFSRQLTMTDATGSTVSFDYDAVERKMTMTTAEGVVIVTKYNQFGETIRVITTDTEETAPTVVIYEYDVNGQLNGVYDMFGDRMATRTISRYDRAGRLYKTIDANDSVTQYSYDGANRILTKTEGFGTLNLVTQYSYYSAGTHERMLRVTQPNGIVTVTSYDRDGRLYEVTTDPGGADETVTRYQYDDENNTITTFEAPGTAEVRVTRYQYDNLGRRISEVIDPGTPPHLNITTQYRYDHNNNLTRKIDAEGHSTWYVYDASDRLTFTIDALGGITETLYDAENRVVGTRRLATSIPLLDVAEWVTDDVDMLVVGEDFTPQHVNTLDQYTQTLYDRDGRAVFTVNPMGGVTHRTFDLSGNVTREVFYNLSIPVTTYADAAAVGTAIASARGVASFDLVTPTTADHIRWTTYDVRNRAVFSVDGLGYVTKNVYDDADNVTRVIAFADAFVGDATDFGDLEDFAEDNAADTGNRITRYWYDGLNRLRFTLDAEGWLKEIAYSEATRERVEVSYYAKMGGATIVDTTTYAQLDAAVNPAGNGNNQIVTTHYDAAGRIDLVTDAAGSESYDYDDVGNRIAFTNKNGDTWTYVYDANGRMLDEVSPEVDISDVTGSTELAAPTVKGRIITRMTYDHLGNVTSRREGIKRVGTTEFPETSRLTEYGYDKLGRQTSVDFPDAYIYNYDTHQAELNQNLRTETTYDVLGNATRFLDIGGRYSYKAYDQLGRVAYELDTDIREEGSDPSEHYVTKREYDAFGNVTSLTRYAQSIAAPAFTNDRLDPTQLASAVSGLESNAFNRKITTTYDRVNRVVYVREPDVEIYDSEQDISYQSAPITYFEYNAFGDVIRESRLVRGNLVDENNPDPTVANAWAQTYRYYDRRGNKIAELDPLRYLTTYKYDDASGDLTEKYEYANALLSAPTDLYTVPTGTASLPSTLPGINNLTAEAGYDRRWTYTYDKLNRLKSETLNDALYSAWSGTVFGYNTGSMVTTYEYDAVGNRTEVTASGITTISYYDELGRVIGIAQSRRDLAGGVAFTPYTRLYRDVYGNLVKQQQFANDAGVVTAAQAPVVQDNDDDRITIFKLDKYGRAIQTQDAKGAQRYAAYTARGDVAYEWQYVTNLNPDPNGQQPLTELLSTTYFYDALGRQKRVVEPQSATQSRTSEADYNAFGEITAKRVPGMLEGTEYFRYDNAGRVWSTNGNDGVNKINLYDLAGHLTAQLRHPDDDLELYTSLGAVPLNEAGMMRTEMVYDLLGRLTQQRDPEHDILSQYEAIDGQFAIGTVANYFTFGNSFQLYDDMTPTFTYRVGNGAPVSLTVDEVIGDMYGVNISGLGVGDYSYELVYSRNGVDFAKSVGTLHITGPGTGTFVDGTAEALIQESVGVIRSQRVDRWGNAVEMTVGEASDPGRQTTKYRYDQLNQLIAIEEPEVEVVDTLDNIFTTQPGYRPKSFNRYDLNGRLVGTQDGRGNVNRIEYDAVGQKITEINADDAATSGASRKHYAYDKFGQLTLVREDGYDTRYQYNKVGELTAMAREISHSAFDLQTDSWFPQVDPSRYDYVVYSYQYDEAGRRIWETTGEFMNDGSTQETKRYWYDGHGNLIRVREPRGLAVVHVGTTDIPLAFETLYEYDVDGNKIKETDGNGSVSTWQYDHFKRVRSHQQLSNDAELPNGDPKFSTKDYGAAGDEITYDYNELGLLETQTSDFGQHITYSYDGAGHLTKITERSTSHTAPNNGATLFAVTRDTEYRYDKYGRRIRERLVVDGVEHQDATATYDAQNRLKTVTDLRDSVTYSYDAAGNRTRIQAQFEYNISSNGSQDLWYVYDSMNRVVLSQGRNDSGTVTIAGTTTGVELDYNARGYRSEMRTNGKRVQEQHWTFINPQNLLDIRSGTGFKLVDGEVLEQYVYDGLGRLITTHQAQDEFTRFNQTVGPVTTTMVQVDARQYDRASRQTFQETQWIKPGSDEYTGTEEWRRVKLTYDDNGRLLTQSTYDYNADLPAAQQERLESVVAYGDAVYASAGTQIIDLPWGGDPIELPYPHEWTPGFDAAGVLHGYVVRVYNADGTESFTTTHRFEYRLGESYQEVSHDAKSQKTGPGTTPLPGSTTKQYNVNGELIRFEDEAAAPAAQKNRVFANNAMGQAVTVIAGAYTDDPAINASLFRMALEPNAETGTVNAQMNRYWNGQQVGTFGYLQQDTIAFSANFDVNYTPISDHYPTATPSEVTVQVGDTLRAIAQRLFGDGSLWYVIADANGLQVGPDTELVEQVGWPLRVPNEVVSMSNTDSSFKPFDISDALGDTSPTQQMPPPPRPKKKGCGVIGQILMIVVAIVVTYFTWGAATSAIGTSLGAASNFVAGAIAGAAGSIASQAVGIATGVQDGFSWTAVAASALTAGILKGTPIGNVTQGGTSFGQIALQGAVNSSVSQGVNIALGLQDSFSWREVAISAVSTAVASEVSERIGFDSVSVPKAVGEFGSQLVAGATSALVRRAMGGKMDSDAVVADVFGTAIGNAIVGGMTPRSITSPASVGSDSDDELQEVEITARYLDDAGNPIPARLENNPRARTYEVVTSPDDARAIAAASGPIEEIVRTAPRWRLGEELIYQQQITSSLFGYDGIHNEDWAAARAEYIYAHPDSWEAFAMRAGVVANALTVPQGFVMNSYQSAVNEFSNGNNSWGYRAVNLLGATAMLPLAVTEELGRGVLNIPSAFFEAAPLIGQAGMEFGAMFDSSQPTDVRILGALGGVRDSAFAFLGLAGPFGLTQPDMPPLSPMERQAYRGRTATTEAWETYTDDLDGPRPGGAAFVDGEYRHSIVPRTNAELYGEPATRTVAEAKEILERIGHDPEMLSEYHFVKINDSEYATMSASLGGKQFEAAYGNVPHGTTMVSFEKNIQSGIGGEKKIPVWVREHVFESDEAIAQVLSHEIHEIENLRYDIKAPVSKSVYNDMIHSSRYGNLHYQAMQEGDDALRRFRRLLMGNGN